MVTTTNQIQIVTDSGGNRHEAHPIIFMGVSADTKPTQAVANGAAFIEMDTSTIYFYDLEGQQWRAFGGESNG